MSIRKQSTIQIRESAIRQRPLPLLLEENAIFCVTADGLQCRITRYDQIRQIVIGKRTDKSRKKRKHQNSFGDKLNDNFFFVKRQNKEVVSFSLVHESITDSFAKSERERYEILSCILDKLPKTERNQKHKKRIKKLYHYRGEGLRLNVDRVEKLQPSESSDDITKGLEIAFANPQRDEFTESSKGEDAIESPKDSVLVLHQKDVGNDLAKISIISLLEKIKQKVEAFDASANLPKRSTSADSSNLNQFDASSKRNTSAESPKRNTSADSPKRNTSAESPKRNTSADSPKRNTSDDSPKRSTSADSSNFNEFDPSSKRILSSIRSTRTELGGLAKQINQIIPLSSLIEALTKIMNAEKATKEIECSVPPPATDTNHSFCSIVKKVPYPSESIKERQRNTSPASLLSTSLAHDVISQKSLKSNQSFHSTESRKSCWKCKVLGKNNDNLRDTIRRETRHIESILNL